MRALYGPGLYERLTEIVDARHGPAGPADALQAFALAMAELWRGRAAQVPRLARPVAG